MTTMSIERWKEWFDIEHTEVGPTITYCGRRFVLTDLRQQYRGYQYDYASRQVSFELTAYPMPPEPPKPEKPKRTWARSMGLRRPK